MKKLTEKLILEEPIDEIEVEEKDIEIPEAELEEPIQVNDILQDVVDNAYGNLISNSISREWDDINSYKDLVAQFVSDNQFPEVVDILNQLIDDKTINVGMLTKALELINGTEQNNLMQQGIDKAEEVISDERDLAKEVAEESLNESKDDVVFECHDFIIRKCGEDCYSLWLSNREKGVGKTYSTTTKTFKTIDDAKNYAKQYYGKDYDESLKEDIQTYGYIIKDKSTDEVVEENDRFTSKDDAYDKAVIRMKCLLDENPSKDYEIEITNETIDTDFDESLLKEWTWGQIQTFKQRDKEAAKRRKEREASYTDEDKTIRKKEI